MSEFQAHRCYKARKEHFCYECHGTIFKQEIYHAYVGFYDGFYYIDMCEDCYTLMAEVNKDKKYEDRLCFGELYEFIFDRDDLELRRRFISICDKRGRIISNSSRV